MLSVGHGRLTAIGGEVGLGDGFAAGLDSGKSLDWPPYVTARADALGVSGTPTVLVNGQQSAVSYIY